MENNGYTDALAARERVLTTLYPDLKETTMDTGRLNGWGQPYFWSAAEVEENLGVEGVAAAVEAENLVNNANVGIARPVAACAQVHRALRRRQNSPRKFGNVLPVGYTPIKRDFRGVGGRFQCPVVGCEKVLTRIYEIERHVSEKHKTDINSGILVDSGNGTYVRV